MAGGSFLCGRFEVLKFVIATQISFSKNPLQKNNKRINGWNRHFIETGCLCEDGGPGRPHASAENVERAHDTFQQNLCKLMVKASRKLGCKKQRCGKYCIINHNKLCLSHTNCRCPQHQAKWKDVKFTKKMEGDGFMERLIFTNEATFHISGKVNRSNIEHKHDSEKIIFFILYPAQKNEKTASDKSFLIMLENWLLPKLNNN